MYSITKLTEKLNKTTVEYSNYSFSDNNFTCSDNYRRHQNYEFKFDNTARTPTEIELFNFILKNFKITRKEVTSNSIKAAFKYKKEAGLAFKLFRYFRNSLNKDILITIKMLQEDHKIPFYNAIFMAHKIVALRNNKEFSNNYKNGNDAIFLSSHNWRTFNSDKDYREALRHCSSYNSLTGRISLLTSFTLTDINTFFNDLLLNNQFRKCHNELRKLAKEGDDFNKLTFEEIFDKYIVDPNLLKRYYGTNPVKITHCSTNTRNTIQIKLLYRNEKSHRVLNLFYKDFIKKE